MFAAIDLSKAVLKRVHYNFLWAFVYNLISIPVYSVFNRVILSSGDRYLFVVRGGDVLPFLARAVSIAVCRNASGAHFIYSCMCT